MFPNLFFLTLPPGSRNNSDAGQSIRNNETCFLFCLQMNLVDDEALVRMLASCHV
jgi:hypothetical protein